MRSGRRGTRGTRPTGLRDVGFVGGRGHPSQPVRQADGRGRGAAVPRRTRVRGRDFPDLGNLLHAMEEATIADTDPPPTGVPAAAAEATNPPPPLPPPLEETEVMALGLDLSGFVGRHSTPHQNNRRFRAHYGIGSSAVAAMYNDLRGERVTCNRILMTLNFLKLYDTEHVLPGRWKLDERLLREIIRETLDRLQQLKEKKIVWGDWEDEDIFVVSVDGVHCRIREVRRDPSAKWFDHESHGAGLTYEIGIAIRSGKLVWIKGPFPASTHDVTMFRGEANEDPLLLKDAGNNQAQPQTTCGGRQWLQRGA